MSWNVFFFKKIANVAPLCKDAVIKSIVPLALPNV